MVAVQHERSGRSRIVAAARRLFAEQGFHQTPMSELGVDAGVSIGQIYRHFKGKNDIILAIVEEDIAQRMEKMMEIRDQVRRGEKTIEEGITLLCLLALAEEDEALSFEMLAEAHRSPVVGTAIEILCQGYRGLIRDLARIAHPPLSEEGLNAAEELLLACMFGLGHRSLSAPRLSAAATATQTARMLLSALRGVT
ncbi:TetR/AcrR family transcriptional regulator [soil metagenome]